MKYEEWIKYERIRLSQSKKLAWISWVKLPSEGFPTRHNKTENFTPRLWTLIVQYVNSWKI